MLEDDWIRIKREEIIRRALYVARCRANRDTIDPLPDGEADLDLQDREIEMLMCHGLPCSDIGVCNIRERIGTLGARPAQTYKWYKTPIIFILITIGSEVCFTSMPTFRRIVDVVTRTVPHAEQCLVTMAYKGLHLSLLPLQAAHGLRNYEELVLVSHRLLQPGKEMIGGLNRVPRALDTMTRPIG